MARGQEQRIAELQAIGKQIEAECAKRNAEEHQLSSQIEAARRAETQQLARLEEVRRQLAVAEQLRNLLPDGRIKTGPQVHATLEEWLVPVLLFHTVIPAMKKDFLA